MTVSRLCEEMTIEELVAWVTFFELKNEYEEKRSKKIERKANTRTM